MQIDFKALEQALAPIEEIGQGEITFDAGLTTLTLRVLLPHEEVEAQKYAAQALNEADTGEHNAVDYLDRFRLGCLSHAVVAVGDTSFRNVEYVETGQVLDNGKPVKVPRYKAMRDLLRRWTRSTLTAVYAKFNELVQRTEFEAERLIEYEPSAIPAEIDRLQKRLDELRAQQEQDQVADKIRFANKVGVVQEDARGVPASKTEPVQTDDEGGPINPEQAMSPVHRQGPVLPHTAPPPPERQVQGPTGEAPAPARAPGRQGPPLSADSSFINPEDDEAMNTALDDEHNRLLAMRRRAAMGRQPANEGSALQAIHPQLGGRRPPHMDAAEADADVRALGGPVPSAEEVGTLGGAPVFRMPVQELETRVPRMPPSAIPSPTVDGGSKNPRFQPPKKP